MTPEAQHTDAVRGDATSVAAAPPAASAPGAVTSASGEAAQLVTGDGAAVPLQAQVGPPNPFLIATVLGLAREDEAEILAQGAALREKAALVVASKLRCARDLLNFEGKTKRARRWRKRFLRKIGLSEGTARRLLLIAESALCSPGLMASRIGERLPMDEAKLEALAPLRLEQLDAFLVENDVNRLSRRQVVELVGAHLDAVLLPPAPAGDRNVPA
jgi:hypothetical protein